ncbi:MAG: polyprenyl synthetase family protein [Oscillospiraceae bacterium]|nr:polyprenyl synthetase family protein [Oscillospiraceae bacterium]
MTYLEQLKQDQALVEEHLQTYFTGAPAYQSLYESMRYSLLAGGKRIRPVLVLESCRMCGGDLVEALPFACAIEMVHTYSLIHDDLPCMDDDDYRRGRLTNHKVYGEAEAVLAGDGLLTAAFGVMLSPERQALGLRAMTAAGILARAAGEDGMVAGQILDLAGEGRALSLEEVEAIDVRKTGALLMAACEMGCVLAGGSEQQREAVRTYARYLGLAFQMRDDLLDVVGDRGKLGKDTGMDAVREKSTYVSLLGLEGCGLEIQKTTEAAKEALAGFAENGFLLWLADELARREN